MKLFHHSAPVSLHLCPTISWEGQECSIRPELVTGDSVSWGNLQKVRLLGTKFWRYLLATAGSSGTNY
jgi:hypothetical protein